MPRLSGGGRTTHASPSAGILNIKSNPERIIGPSLERAASECQWDANHAIANDSRWSPGGLAKKKS